MGPQENDLETVGRAEAGGPLERLLDGAATTAENRSERLPVLERLGRARTGWRHWRRGRPFWGGLFGLLGGLETLATVKAPLPVLLHVGLQGTASYVVPLVIILSSVLAWVTPGQRLFYAVLVLVLSLVSWLTSNLGGFFVGLLLGLLGGSLILAWTDQPRADP